MWRQQLRGANTHLRHHGAPDQSFQLQFLWVIEGFASHICDFLRVLKRVQRQERVSVWNTPSQARKFEKVF